LRSLFMPQNFLYPQRDQPLLLPADMREWLPEDDLVFVVLDAVATLDLGGFRRRYRADGHGRAAFDPEMMVALLLYGYCQGERSSRVIEKRCVRDVGYRVIAGGLSPDHATIARFRARHQEALGGLFSQVLRCWPRRAWCRWACSAWMAPSWPAMLRRRRTGRCRRLRRFLQLEAEIPVLGALVGEKAVERVAEYQRDQLPHDQNSLWSRAVWDCAF
jgi:transposase